MSNPNQGASKERADPLPPIIASVRRFVATVVLALVTIVHGADPILCADGCTDESRQEATTPVPADDIGECLLCQRSIAAGPQIPPPAQVSYERAIDAMPVSRFITSPPSDIDHPPRLP